MESDGIQNNIIMTNKKKFINLTTKHNFYSAIGYFGLCLILSFLLMSLTLFYLYYIVDGFGMNESLVESILQSGSDVVAIVMGFLLFFVILTHLIARLFGAKISLQKTFQVQAYAYTPFFLFGWLSILDSEGSPLAMAFLVLGTVFSLLSAVNGVFGLKYIHNLSTVKSLFAAVLVPIFAYMCLVILYMMYGAQYGLM